MTDDAPTFKWQITVRPPTWYSRRWKATIRLVSHTEGLVRFEVPRIAKTITRRSQIAAVCDAETWADSWAEEWLNSMEPDTIYYTQEMNP